MKTRRRRVPRHARRENPLRRKRDGTLRSAVALMALLFLCSAIAPALSPVPTNPIDLGKRIQPPSLGHPMGTDDLGRDVLQRVLKGGQVSLSVAFLAVAIALLIGTVVGGIAGYYRGVVDVVAMGLVDLFLAIPVVLVVLFLSTLVRPGLVALGVLVGLTQWMEVTRVIRAVVIAVRAETFVEAARAIGARGHRILFNHVLRHAVSPLLTTATMVFAHAILLESAVSFLGFGTSPPMASWGGMLSDARTWLESAPWLAIFPGGLIFLSVFCMYTIADRLRARTDSRSL